MTGTSQADTERRVLITGFGPFHRHTTNPSGELALLLEGEQADCVKLVGRRFSSSTDSIRRDLREALDEIDPIAVICLGLASGRPLISLERVAINLRDFSIPDAAGASPVDEPVLAYGPPALFTGLPIRDILQCWQDNEVPAHISNTAGTFVCNQAFYLACWEGRRRGIPAGFIHVPDTPHSVATTLGDAPPGPTMELTRLADAIRTAALVTAGVVQATPSNTATPIQTGTTT